MASDNIEVLRNEGSIGPRGTGMRPHPWRAEVMARRHSSGARGVLQAEGITWGKQSLRQRGLIRSTHLRGGRQRG